MHDRAANRRKASGLQCSRQTSTQCTLDEYNIYVDEQLVDSIDERKTTSVRTTNPPAFSTEKRREMMFVRYALLPEWLSITHRFRGMRLTVIWPFTASCRRCHFSFPFIQDFSIYPRLRNFCFPICPCAVTCDLLVHCRHDDNAG